MRRALLITLTMTINDHLVISNLIMETTQAENSVVKRQQVCYKYGWLTRNVIEHQQTGRAVRLQTKGFITELKPRDAPIVVTMRMKTRKNITRIIRITPASKPKQPHRGEWGCGGRWREVGVAGQIAQRWKHMFAHCMLYR